MNTTMLLLKYSMRTKEYLELAKLMLNWEKKKSSYLGEEFQE